MPRYSLSQVEIAMAIMREVSRQIGPHTLISGNVINAIAEAATLVVDVFNGHEKTPAEAGGKAEQGGG